MLDYLRLSPMIGGGSLSLKSNERESEGESMKATPVMCGDHLVPISECDCVNYLQELKTSAERLVQLTKEREGMK